MSIHGPGFDIPLDRYLSASPPEDAPLNCPLIASIDAELVDVEGKIEDSQVTVESFWLAGVKVTDKALCQAVAEKYADALLAHAEEASDGR